VGEEKTNGEMLSFYRALMESSDIGFKIVDRDFKIIEMNARARELLAVGSEDVAGEPCSVGCDFLTKCPCPGKMALKTGKISICEVDKQLSSGEVIPLQLKAIPVSDCVDGLIGFIEIIENISRRRQAEIDRDRFFNLSPHIMAVVGGDGIIYQVNPAIEKVLGWSPSEITGRDFKDIIHPDDYDKTKDKILEVIKKETSILEYENRYITKDGRCRIMSWDAFYLKQQCKMFTIGHDITEKKEIEELLHHSQKMESIGKLAGGIAHDFNNMVFGIIGAGEMLEPLLPDDKEAEDYLNIIMQAARTASKLTQRLLSFSRKSTYENIPVNINDIVIEAVKLMEHSLPERIKITTALMPDPLMLSGDPSSLQNALLNILINARDAVTGEGEIMVKTEIASPPPNAFLTENLKTAGVEYATVSVSDTGGGIPDTDLKKVFEPFFTTKPIGSGTGLGLSAVYGTVKQHNGAISLNSTPDGLTMAIYLPLAEDVSDSLG